jgi:hypothetical protein
MLRSSKIGKIRPPEGKVPAMTELKKLDAARFEAVDIRAIPDDQLGDIVGGGYAAKPNVKFG